MAGTRAEARARRAAEVAAAAAELEASGRLGLTRGYIQHGGVSVYDHVCAVARQSLAMADALARVGLGVDRDALIRGALLHDYFLYDWHEKEAWHRFHGFRHPFFALENALEDFPDLSSRERNIIERHMFPLVVLPPTCREAWIVCLADKVVATRETLCSRTRRGAGHADEGGGSAPTVAAASSAAASAAVPPFEFPSSAAAGDDSPAAPPARTSAAACAPAAGSAPAAPAACTVPATPVPQPSEGTPC